MSGWAMGGGDGRRFFTGRGDMSSSALNVRVSLGLWQVMSAGTSCCHCSCDEDDMMNRDLFSCSAVSVSISSMAGTGTGGPSDKPGNRSLAGAGVRLVPEFASSRPGGSSKGVTPPLGAGSARMD